MSDTAILLQPVFAPASFTREGEAISAQLSLMLDHHLDCVWAALTESKQLELWLAVGEIEPREGGRVRLSFAGGGMTIDSTVTAIQPEHMLEYSWSQAGEPDRPVRWALDPIGAAVRLDMTVTTPAGEDAARMAASWAAHLEMLAASLSGKPIPFPMEAFKAAQSAYREQIEAL